WSIAAQCRELGAEPIYLGIAADTPDDIERRLRAGLAADVIVSSAGVSVGDRDFVRGVLEKLGCRLDFWGVRIKPGYPLAFGRVVQVSRSEPQASEDQQMARGPLVFGLPGNPVSAMMTFEQFVRPALLRMQGAARLHRPLVRARLAESMRKKPGRMHFVRVALAHEGGAVIARSTGNQSSGVLTSMIRAQGILVFPAEAGARAARAPAHVRVPAPTSPP